MLGKKFISRFVVSSIIFFMVLVLSCYILVRSPWFFRKITPYLASTLKENAGLHYSVREQSIDLLGDISLEGLILKWVDHGSSNTFELRAEEFRFSYDLWQLVFSQLLRVDHFYLKHATFKANLTKSLVAQESPESSDSSLDLQLKEFVSFIQKPSLKLNFKNSLGIEDLFLSVTLMDGKSRKLVFQSFFSSQVKSQLRASFLSFDSVFSLGGKNSFLSLTSEKENLDLFVDLVKPNKAHMAFEMKEDKNFWHFVGKSVFKPFDIPRVQFSSQGSLYKILNMTGSFELLGENKTRLATEDILTNMFQFSFQNNLKLNIEQLAFRLEAEDEITQGKTQVSLTHLGTTKVSSLTKVAENLNHDSNLVIKLPQLAVYKVGRKDKNIAAKKILIESQSNLFKVTSGLNSSQLNFKGTFNGSDFVLQDMDSLDHLGFNFEAKGDYKKKEFNLQATSRIFDDNVLSLNLNLDDKIDFIDFSHDLSLRFSKQVQKWLKLESSLEPTEDLSIHLKGLGKIEYHKDVSPSDLKLKSAQTHGLLSINNTKHFDYHLTLEDDLHKVLLGGKIKLQSLDRFSSYFKAYKEHDFPKITCDLSVTSELPYHGSLSTFLQKLDRKNLFFTGSLSANIKTEEKNRQQDVLFSYLKTHLTFDVKGESLAINSHLQANDFSHGDVTVKNIKSDLFLNLSLTAGGDFLARSQGILDFEKIGFFVSQNKKYDLTEIFRDLKHEFSFLIKAKEDSNGQNFFLPSFAVSNSYLLFSGNGQGNFNDKNLLGRSQIKFQVPHELESMPQFSGSGSLNIPLEFSVHKGRYLNLLGQIELAKLNMKVGQYELQGLRGGIPIEQNLYYDKGIRFAHERILKPFLRVDFSQIKPYLKNTAELSLESIRNKEIKLGPGKVSMSLLDNLVKIPYFELDLLGGHLGGQFQGDLASKSKSMMLLGRVTKIDPSRLSLKKQGKSNSVQHDSFISGRGALRLSLEKNIINGRFDVTDIGSSQLKALIDVLDPEGENESLAKLYPALSIASPSSLEAKINHGFMDLSVGLNQMPNPITISGVNINPFVQQLMNDFKFED